MKKLFLGLMILSSMSTFAGTLRNRLTAETLEFSVDTSTGELVIVSTAAGIGSGKIKLSRLSEEKSSLNILAGTQATTAQVDEREGGLGAVFFVPFGVAYDVLLLPIKGPIKLAQNATFKNDFKKLREAIISTETKEVSDGSFKRIVELLTKS